MTVKELINKLLDCRMDARVYVLVELKNEYVKEQMEGYGGDKYPIDDDFDIDDVESADANYVRISLEEM